MTWILEGNEKFQKIKFAYFIPKLRGREVFIIICFTVLVTVLFCVRYVVLALGDGLFLLDVAKVLCGWCPVLSMPSANKC